MDSSILHSLIDADIDALLRKVSLLGDGETPALVSGLLLAARRLLGGSESLAAGEDWDSPESEPATSAALAAMNGRGSDGNRPRRNLRAEMAGPLPGLGRNGQSAASGGQRPRPKVARKARPVVATTASPPARIRRVSSDGISGGEPDEYRIIQLEPGRHCPDCGSTVGSHPVDRNLPERDGMQAVVLCNRDRCYTLVGDMD